MIDIKLYITAVLIFLSIQLMGQNEGILYSFNKGNIIATFDNTLEPTKIDSLLYQIGSNLSITDSLNSLKGKKKTNMGWELISYTDNHIIYQKPINSLAGTLGKYTLGNKVVEKLNEDPFNLDVKFGVNDFKAETVKRVSGNTFRVFLAGHTNAENVYLSGTFNNWKTNDLRMKRLFNGWEIELMLLEGKSLYKFIIDGSWKLDPGNKLKEEDCCGNLNSVFFNTNYTFKLYSPNAKKVYLAGTFNNWAERDLKLNNTSGEWVLPMYLKEGTYAYKYIVDGNWKTDPGNPQTRPDGNGNVNSIIDLGESVNFVLNDFLDAEKVVLTGNFINWSENELIMNKSGSNWKYSIVLAPGNYEYKYIVDGSWRVDPDNEHTIGTDDYVNSVFVNEPNHTFILKNYENARSVIVTGTFNGWAEDGYRMKKTPKGWVMDIHLPKGKTRYKFIVDGEWISDPDNSLWEPNQYGSNDSVLWIK